MNGIFPEWLNANSGRAFPLAENSSRLDITGSVKLPDSLIVAAQINQTPRYATGTFYISELVASPDLVSITISFWTDSATAVRRIATIGVPVALHIEGKSYAFIGEGSDGSILGSLTIGSLIDTLRGVPGELSFEVGSTPFEVSALFISTPALEAIEVYNGTTLLGRFSTILKLRAGENIRLSYVDDDPDVIRIDAIDGLNLTNPGDCANAIAIPPCIRTINDIPPDDNGNFNLDGGQCINVDVEVGTISLVDLCSQSCCGCTELETLLTGLQGVEQQVTAFRTQMTDVVGQQTTMIANLAANIR